MEESKTIEQLLADGNRVQIAPRGYSMYPLIVPGRDYAIIEKTDVSKGKRGDVMLYRRKEGILVLHRVYRHTKEGYYMVGDNQKEIEGPLQEMQIKGKMTGMIRNGRKISQWNLIYQSYAKIWLALRIFRPQIAEFIHRKRLKYGKKRV